MGHALQFGFVMFNIKLLVPLLEFSAPLISMLPPSYVYSPISQASLHDEYESKNKSLFETVTVL